jgi:hypothetical protein
LYKLEGQESGSAYDFESDSGTIEHILPESFPVAWHEFFSEDEYERNIYLLGNLTLLEPSKNNKDAADADFEKKKSVYLTSTYSITNKINNNSWTAGTVKQRQGQLARLATAIWKI